MSPTVLPAACEVLVIGAGPAGSACARTLAQAGREVLLVDQHEFPREKVCGDGLIPDAHAALRALGVYDEVMDRAFRAQHVRCVAPRGGHVDVPGTLAVLPRRELDDIVCRAAREAGARFAAPWRFVAPLLDGERVVGARLKGPDGEHEVQARWVVLATGASVPPLVAAGVCERRAPSGVALRGYVHHPELAQTLRELQIVWHPRLSGGYGWIFPGPGGVFNVGAGLTGSHATEAGGRASMRDVNLRQMLEAFASVHAPAAELLERGELRGDWKGAPLRCSLGGARWSRPGLLVTGEAAGSTYAFSGEGIGKALETGLLAAAALLEGGDDAAVRARHEAALAGLKPRFALYEKASHVNHRPWLADLVVWRARRSPRILRRMSAVLEERQNPGRLLSWRGITKLMFE
ncbi:NAD(P)/FAD-dependent oxidoreductase [Rubrivivax gelatinosus]|uniref:Putative monooxygenase n=1 Tax=Rubrivivax gelatinosus (strain NBRC 100245 / IL144) TaxID=983917 RepID=I0HY37_RUBGI|nr:FAD-dependent monooxygenase [Rubrivivax gelatinosus]BAL97924.1 putative monooxygenase [Rubrivivax gelatinosus IL144]